MSDPIEHLTLLFEKFPGIGPRQAGRFVQYLLRNKSVRHELIAMTEELEGGVKQCSACMRYFAGTANVCGICSNPQRDDTLLAVVASDADLLALERSGTYLGRYFVLGGTISLASEHISHLRMPQLIERIAGMTKNVLSEIILAFPANPEGDATAVRVLEEISNFNIPITKLGRGLSTGSELEYADSDTLKSAFESRK